MDSCGREGRQLVNLTVQVTQHISLLSTKKENTGPDLFWLRIALKDGQTGTANTEGRLATYSLKKKEKITNWRAKCSSVSCGWFFQEVRRRNVKHS